MPKVTKVEPQKIRSDRYSISIDGQYSFSLSTNDLLSLKVYAGQELSESELSQIQLLAGQSKVLDKVYNYLSYRSRTESEVRYYLKRQACESEQIDSIVHRLKEQQLLRDGQFAEAWINSRQTLRPRSRRQLEQELRQKGIEASLIAETIDGVTDDEEVEAIKMIVKKKLTLTKYQDQSKLISYLSTQGFSYGLVKRALDDLSAAGGE